LWKQWLRVLPVVPAGTWMAAELLRHDLPELIVDWQASTPRNWRLAADDAVRRKLAVMRAAYLHEHGVEAYAAVLQALYAHAPGRT
jgi:hypothetical protein